MVEWIPRRTVDHKVRCSSPATALMSFGKTFMYICHTQPKWCKWVTGRNLFLEMPARRNGSRANARVIIKSTRSVKSDRHECYTRAHYYYLLLLLFNRSNYLLRWLRNWPYLVKDVKCSNWQRRTNISVLRDHSQHWQDVLGVSFSSHRILSTKSTGLNDWLSNSILE